MPFSVQYSGACEWCEELVGRFTWLPFPFLFFINRVRVGNSVTFNGATKNCRWRVRSVWLSSVPPSFLAPALRWDQREQVPGRDGGKWSRSGLIHYLDKFNSAFAIKYLLSSWFPLALFCFTSHHWAEDLSVQLSVLVGSFCSSKDYANSNWIKELLSTLSDSGKDIPCWHSACRHRFQRTWTSRSTSGFWNMWILSFFGGRVSCLPPYPTGVFK